MTPADLHCDLSLPDREPELGYECNISRKVEPTAEEQAILDAILARARRFPGHRVACWVELAEWLPDSVTREGLCWKHGWIPERIERRELNIAIDDDSWAFEMPEYADEIEAAAAA